MLNKLTLGREYQKTEIAKELEIPEILDNYGGIAETKKFTLLFITMDKTFDAELPKPLNEMTRLERYNHNFPYLDIFDMEENTFNWDSPENMNISSPMIKKFTEKSSPWYLFVRMYHQRWDNDNNPNKHFFYLGKIDYQTIRKGTEFPVHIISNILEPIHNPTKELKSIFEWKPKNYHIRLQEFKNLEEMTINKCNHLASQQEGNRLEFKETFFGNREKGAKDEIKYSCLKTICGFLNRSGGSLVIGVRDEEDQGIHNITGIDFDINYDNDNDYMDRLQASIRATLDDGGIINQHIKIKIHKSNKNIKICEIIVKKLPSKHHSTLNGEIYVRQNATTPKISKNKHKEWIDDRN